MRKWFLKSAVLLLAACVLILTGCPGAKGTTPTARTVPMQDFTSAYKAGLDGVSDSSVALQAAHLFQPEGVKSGGDGVDKTELEKANKGKTVKVGDKFWIGFRGTIGTEKYEKAFYIELIDERTDDFDTWKLEITKGVEGSAKVRLSEGTPVTINTLYPTLKFDDVEAQVKKLSTTSTGISTSTFDKKEYKLFVVEEKDEAKLKEEAFYKNLKTPYAGNTGYTPVLMGLKDGGTYCVRAALLYDVDELRDQVYASPVVKFKVEKSNVVEFDFNDGRKMKGGNTNDPLSIVAVQGSGADPKYENGYLMLGNNNMIKSQAAPAGTYFKKGTLEFALKGDTLHKLVVANSFTLKGNDGNVVGSVAQPDVDVFTFMTPNGGSGKLVYRHPVLTANKKASDLSGANKAKWTVTEGCFVLQVAKTDGKTSEMVVFKDVTSSKVLAEELSVNDVTTGAKKATSKAAKAWLADTNFTFEFDFSGVTVKAAGGTVTESVNFDPLYVNEAGLSGSFNLTSKTNETLYFNHVKYTITR